jgi:3-oxoacyl-[acyl-carrier-protein] synthase-3
MRAPCWRLQRGAGPKPATQDLMRRYSRITGTGSYLPPRRLTNADLVGAGAKGVETSDDWIVERTGIRRGISRPRCAQQRPGAGSARKRAAGRGLQARTST